MRMSSLAGLLIVLLFSAGAGAQELYVDNVVVILDASGSMSGKMNDSSQQKLTVAKSAIREVIKTIPQSTHLGVIVFGKNANGWIYPLGPRDDTKLLQAIDAMSPGGGTPLGQFMKMGADSLLAARKAQFGYGSYRLLIVTDGEATDALLVEKYAPDIISRGIITDVIGVDMNQAHTLATKAHSYRRANDPASLTRALQEVFAEIGKTTGSQSGEDVFAELAAFPEELAMPAIAAFTSSGNEPIGSNSGENNVAANNSTQTPPAAATTTTNTPQGSTQPPAEESDRGWLIAVIVIVFILLKLRLRSAGGK